MQAKLNRVFKVIRSVTNLSAFDSAEAAAYLLKKCNGDVIKAVELAKHPFRLNGQSGIHYTY